MILSSLVFKYSTEYTRLWTIELNWVYDKMNSEIKFLKLNLSYLRIRWAKNKKMTNEQLWQAVLGELELSLTKANFTTWLKNTFILELEENKITVAVPNTFTKTWLENKYHKFITDAAKSASKGDVTEVYYKVATTKPKEDKKIVRIKQAIQEDIKEIKETEITTKDKNGLNPRYTFDNFIVGKSNELANAAAQAVAKRPGSAYNPLFVYGGVGLGKTHLLQAIGHEVLKNKENAKLSYITSEQFTNEFVYSIRTKTVKEFQNKYRKLDVLIIDDIQFISGKEQTQEQLFHTFNDLHQNNKQIILSSDRTPKAIPDLEQRLESRFEWGMIVDVSEPDTETKIAIIETKLLEKEFALDKQIIDFLATNIGNNVRELEGMINRIIAHVQLNNQNEITLDTIKDIVKTINLQLPRGSLTPKKIINIVAEFYDITVDDIIGSSRKKELVVPRQIIMFLMREETKSSFPNIGQELGGRDHTTAMHAYSKIQKAIQTDDKIKQDIVLIRQKLYN